MSGSNREPLVSVLMGVYNGERYLRAALESILSQTYSNFEIIVIDDCSTDGSPAILASIPDARLKVFRNVENLGLTKSLIIGRDYACGEFLARQDADDLSHHERFFRQVEYLQAHPQVSLVHTNYEVIDANGMRLETVILPEKTDQELKTQLTFGNIFAHGPIMIRHECYDAVGGYQSFMQVTQDYDLFLRLSEHGELANLSEILYYQRFHAGSIGRNRREKQLSFQALAWDLAKKRRSGLAEGEIPVDVAALFPPDPKRLFQDARGSAYLYYAAGQIDRAEDAIRQALTFCSMTENDRSAWEAWAIAKALHLAEMRENLQDGSDFLIWLTINLRSGGIDLPNQGLLASYFADRAFFYHYAGNRKMVIDCVTSAFYYDFRLMNNWGLWKILLQAMRR